MLKIVEFARVIGKMAIPIGKTLIHELDQMMSLYTGLSFL